MKELLAGQVDFYFDMLIQTQHKLFIIKQKLVNEPDNQYLINQRKQLTAKIYGFRHKIKKIIFNQSYEIRCEDDIQGL